MPDSETVARATEPEEADRDTAMDLLCPPPKALSDDREGALPSMKFVSGLTLMMDKASEDDWIQRTPNIFDSCVVPDVPIGRYIMRFGGLVSDVEIVMAFIYIDRLLHGGYSPGWGQVTRGHMKLYRRTWHRLCLAAILVASKFVRDECWANSHFARRGGVRLAEMNKLEWAVIRRLNRRLMVTREQFLEAENLLVAVTLT